MFLLILAYLGAINAAAFAAFASDKRRAIRGASRIPEFVLLRLAMVGGASGAIAAQQILRHKTRKEPFRTQLWLTAAAQALILLAAGWWTLHRP